MPYVENCEFYKSCKLNTIFCIRILFSIFTGQKYVFRDKAWVRDQIVIPVTCTYKLYYNTSDMYQISKLFT